jgi:hypothetical protein
MMMGRAFGLAAEPVSVRFALALAALISLAAAMANATLIFDDPFLYEAFAKGLAQDGVWRTALTLFLNLDLHVGVPEYRSYGLSKILHFGLWFVFGIHAYLYSAFIALTQAATALVIFAGLRRCGLDSVQALMAALLWMLSPFAVTTCFHHYSYLILPTQISVALAWILYRSLRLGRPLGLRQSLGFVVGGVVLALTGESHLVLAGCLLAYVAWAGAPERAWDAGSRYALVMGSAAATLVLHRLAWSALGPEGVPGRFVFANPGLSQGIDRKFGYALSVPNGARVQVQQILAFSAWSWLVLLVVTASAGFWLHRQMRSVPLTSIAPPNGGMSRLLGVVTMLVAASLTVSWMHHVLFREVGTILPRRYGYVPYTVIIMATAVLLSTQQLRRSIGAWCAPLFTALTLGLWCALQFVCLPIVRHQDAAVWNSISTAIAARPQPALLFVNTWNIQSVFGYNAPGLRGTGFPSIFESPFTRYWWQSQYVRVRLGVLATGNSIASERDQRVVLTGQVAGVHFMPTPPVVADATSVVAVVETGHDVPDWRDGLQAVKVIASWDEFRTTAAFLQTRINVGWSALLHEIFNLPASPVLIDAGRRADSALPDVWPDKRFGEPLRPEAAVAGVRDYGQESGDDSVFLPGGKSGEPLAYLTSNRHGNFTYRIDFAERSSRLVSLDFLDGWAQRPGARLIHLQVELDGRWHDLGVLDTYAVAANEPFVLRFPVRNVQTIRLRFEKAAGSGDIPLLNGIRLQPLV